MRLFKRKNGYYYAEFQRNKRISLNTTDKIIARKLYTALKREYLMGNLKKLNRVSTIKLKDFIDEILIYSENSKAYSTYKEDSLSLRKLYDSIGNKDLCSISNKDVDKFISNQLLTNKRISINKYLRHLRSLFNEALNRKYIEKNPFAGRKLKFDEKPPNFLTADQRKKLFMVIDKPAFLNLIKFYIYTGCRRIEICQLQWKDIDLKNKLILIRKSKTAYKAVPVSETLEKIILSMKVKGFSQVGKVFPHWHPDTISHYFKRYSKIAGIDAKLHDLRHTYASHLALRGESLNTIQELLGHSNIQATLVYTHLTKGHLKRAADGLDFES